MSAAHTPSARVVDGLVVIGTGFMGASIARAAKRHGVTGPVVGIDPRQALAAQSVGCIDIAVPSIDALTACAPLSGCALGVVLASPVKTYGDIFQQLESTFGGARHAQGATTCTIDWITDIGSTKSGVLTAVNAQLPTLVSRFVSSHPMAGSEKQGPEHAREDLLHGARVLISRLEGSADHAVRQVESFWVALGAQPSALPIHDHDGLLAAISHLPHVLAFALAGALAQSPLAVAAQTLHGGGLRDTTRIAASSAELWADIFLDNRTALLAAWSEWSLQLQALHQALEQGDRALLVDLLTQASRWRREF